MQLYLKFRISTYLRYRPHQCRLFIKHWNLRKYRKPTLWYYTKILLVSMIVLKHATIFFALLHFYKRPAFVPLPANQKKSEENFHFYKEKKGENNVQHLSYSEPLHRQSPPWAVRVALFFYYMLLSFTFFISFGVIW